MSDGNSNPSTQQVGWDTFWLTNPKALVQSCKSISLSVALNISTLVLLLVSILLLIFGFKFWWLILLLGILIILIIQLIAIFSIEKFRKSPEPIIEENITRISEDDVSDMTQIQESTMVEGYTPLSDSDDEFSDSNEIIPDHEGYQNYDHNHDHHSYEHNQCYAPYASPCGDYILPSSILPSQTGFTFSNTLDNSKNFMNQQSQTTDLQFRKSMVDCFLSKQDRWKRFGCCPSPYGDSKPMMIE